MLFVACGCATTDARHNPAEGNPAGSARVEAACDVEDPSEALDLAASRLPEPPGPPEVVENRDYDGRLIERIEGYRDEEGEFIRHGRFTSFHVRGNKKLEEIYLDGVVHGPRISWYDSGQIMGRGCYNHGREDGTWSAWWPNGFKQREWHMVDGAFHGTMTRWHQNGEKRMEVEFVWGLKQGPLVIWDERGNEVHRSEYVNDIEQP